MGTEWLWVPAVMSVVAAGAQYVDTRNQAKKADRQTAQALLRAGERQKRADAEVQKYLADLATSTPDAEKRGSLQNYMAQLQQAEAGSQAGLSGRGGTSGAFQRDAASAALGIREAGSREADIAARLDAPVLQRQRERRGLTDAAIGVDLIGREQRGDDAVTNLQLRGIRSNPWLQALEAAASGAAAGYGGGGAAAGGGGTSPISGVSTSPYMGNSAFGAWGSGWAP